MGRDTRSAPIPGLEDRLGIFDELAAHAPLRGAFFLHVAGLSRGFLGLTVKYQNAVGLLPTTIMIGSFFGRSFTSKPAPFRAM